MNTTPKKRTRTVAATTVNTAVSLPTSKSVTNTLKVSGEYELVDNVFIGLVRVLRALFS